MGVAAHETVSQTSEAKTLFSTGKRSDLFSGNLLERLHNFQYRTATSCTEIINFTSNTSLFPDSVKRSDMSLCKIDYVKEIANGCS